VGSSSVDSPCGLSDRHVSSENIPRGTTATIRGVPNLVQMTLRNTSEIGHFQHGDANGGFIWDPWQGPEDSGRPVNRIDAIIIKRKED